MRIDVRAAVRYLGRGTALKKRLVTLQSNSYGIMLLYLITRIDRWIVLLESECLFTIVVVVVVVVGLGGGWLVVVASA